MKTTVINVRGRDRAALLADPNFVYVGRGCSGFPASPWGNPFKVGMDPFEAMRILDREFEIAESRMIRIHFDGKLTAGKAVECFGHWAMTRFRQRSIKHRDRWRDELHKLRGKSLGCWCLDWDGDGKPPMRCHAVMLATMADSATAPWNLPYGDTHLIPDGKHPASWEI